MATRTVPQMTDRELLVQLRSAEERVESLQDTEWAYYPDHVTRYEHKLAIAKQQQRQREIEYMFPQFA